MTADKKTFVILTPGFPENEADTTCLPAHQVFVKALKKNFPSLNIIILTFHYPFFAGNYIWFENTVISFNGRNKKKFRRIFLWKKIWQQLKKIKKENNVTGILNFWCGECALVGNYFGRATGITHYNWITGQDAKKENWFVKLIRPGTGELFAMSDFLTNEFYKNHGVRPSLVIPNGIDTGLFSIERPEKNIDILGAGSLIKLKQYNIFIEVVKEIAKKFSTANIVLCGKGPEENNLRTMADELQLQKEIEFKGELQHDDLLRLMQRAKILLHTSAYEGFSTVCLEALYAGAHVISFCKPMENKIDHWHIVATKKEMIEKAIEILSDTKTQYAPVLAYTMDDVAKSVMQLF